MKIKDVKATSTDYAGNGYYRGKDGKYWYGNVQNGYLTETEAEARARLAKSNPKPKPKSAPSQNSNASSRRADTGADTATSIIGFLLGYFLTSALINGGSKTRDPNKFGYLQSDTGTLKEVKIGFSWTTLLFGFFPALFRKDIKWAVVMFFAGSILGTIFGVFIDIASSLILTHIIFAFIYNKLYIKDLIAKGYMPVGNNFANILKQKGISFNEYIQD